MEAGTARRGWISGRSPAPVASAQTDGTAVWEQMHPLHPVCYHVGCLPGIIGQH